MADFSAKVLEVNTGFVCGRGSHYWNWLLQDDNYKKNSPGILLEYLGTFGFVQHQDTPTGSPV